MQEILKSIMDTISEGVVYQEASGEIKIWNRSAAKMFGLQADQAVGQTSISRDWHLIFEDGSPCPGDQHPSMITLRTGQALEGEVRGIKQNQGSVTWLSVNTRPLFQPGQKLPHAVVISFRDITRHKQAEDEMRQSQQRVRQVTSLSREMVWEVDQQGMYTYLSEGVAKILGYEPGELVGKKQFYDLHPKEGREAFKQAAFKVFARQGTFTNFINQALSKQGSLVWLSTNGMPLLDAQGSLLGYRGSDSDITERKQAQENYRTLFQEMLDGFALHEIICDQAGEPVDYRFLTVNPAFEHMTGLAAQDLIGRTVLEVMPGTEPHWIRTYGKVALTGEPVFFENYSGELEKYFEVTAFRPAPNQFACIFADITERKRAEEEKAKLEAQLQQAQKMDALGTLASGIAHDFNNLLAAIMGYSELVQEELDRDSPIRQDIAQITKAASRAQQLVRQILTFSRRSQADRRAISLNRVIQETAAILERTLPKMVSIHLELDDKLRLVSADPQQMEQVLINLASNAADAMEGRGTLHVATSNVKVQGQYCDICGQELAGPYVALSMRDSGSGMDPETKAKIFDPFFTTKEVGRGTGLGLSTVYGILTSHEGHLVCHTQKGAGTEFMIYLPLAEPGSSVQRATGVDPAVNLRGQETVLVVDDEETIRYIAGKILSRNGYKVMWASSGEEALQTYGDHSGRIDCVLLDLGMPGMGGKGCLPQIIKLDPLAKVLIASGYIQYELTDELQSLGAAGMVAKPYRKVELLRKLRQLLDE